ncbi:hypothetical protein GDO86_009233 [Hymenochirus boettgeri]|uniref:Uncharacterized protein n=1 Tax=Hymenochirus boettgeri TaxID=247094 RepID=A0A8T2JJT4_9PIPI|nr:hypothetical protein GDO86_009233 [Hymenochirus boettgeri]
MADWLKKIPRNDINLLAQQDEVKNLNIDYASRSNLPHSLPVIAGVGLGVQSAKMFNRALGDKPRKSFPRTVKLERIGRPVISRSVQVSSSNETTYLPQIEALQKEIVLLTDALKEKDDTILHLREIHKEKTLLYAKDLEQEINHHNITKHQLEENQILVIETERLLEERILHYEKGNQELKDQYEKNITSLQKLSQSEISSKDDKIRKLKQQISDLFKEKSCNVINALN